MKITRGILTFSTVVTLACSCAMGQNVSVTDYDVAVSKARDLRIDADYNLAMQGDSTTVDQGNAAIALKRFYSSLPLEWGIDGRGTVTELDGDFTGLVDVSGRVKKFLNDKSNFFGGGQIDMSYSSEADILGRDEPRTDITAIAGYGRFVDATPLAKAVRIEEFLIEEGILSGHLPKNVILEIAYLIERQQEFREHHGATYKAHWYDAIEAEMAKSGQLQEQGLGALGTLRVEEVLFEERVQNRFYGWDATVGVGVTATTPDTTKSRGDGVATLGFRWSRPVAWRTQLDQQFQLRTPLKSSFGKEVNLTVITRYIYELTNRIDFSASHILSYTKVADAPVGVDDQAFDHSANFAFLFYIENYVNWTVDLTLNKFENQDLLTTIRTGIGVDIW